MSWFSFTGSDPSQPSHYTLAGETPPSCATPTEQMCALQATNSAGSPVITDALKNEIINSLQNQVNGTNVRLKSR